MILPALLVLISGSAFGLNAAEEAPSTAKAGKEKKQTAEQVRLYVEGAYCPGCAGVLREALELSGLKKPSKISANGGEGYVIVYGDFAHASDLSKIAIAINGAQTPHKKISKPGVSLELFAKLTDESGAKALKALKKVKGVDAQGSQVDSTRGVIGVRLVGDQPVTVDGIIAALKQDGIEAKVETDTVKRFIETPAKVEEEAAK
jgi:hypothetical protein